MELKNKLQELRKQKGMTQEEVAGRLFVSRTAVSKWESGRGYPSIDSLKAIAVLYGVTVDELLSTNEAILLAEESIKSKKMRMRDLVFGLLDVCMALLFFLPVFALRSESAVRSVSLFALPISYVTIAFIFLLSLASALGILTLALCECRGTVWLKLKHKLSVTFGAVIVLVFIISTQPYVATYAFVLLGIKAVVLLKN